MRHHRPAGRPRGRRTMSAAQTTAKFSFQDRMAPLLAYSVFDIAAVCAQDAGATAGSDCLGWPVSRRPVGGGKQLSP